MFGLGEAAPRVQVRNDKDGFLFTLAPELQTRSFTNYASNLVDRSRGTTTSVQDAPISPPPARWFGPVAAIVAGALVFGAGVLIVRRRRK